MAPNRYAPYEAGAGRRPKSNSTQRGNGSSRNTAAVARRRAGSGASGQTVGNYMLGKKIGEGTFGQVRQGTHILTGEKVRGLQRLGTTTTPPTVITSSPHRYTHYDIPCTTHHRDLCQHNAAGGH